MSLFPVSTMEDEHFFACPHCGAQISVLLDLTIDQQAYIEDCEVCCQPMHIEYRASENLVQSFSVSPVEQ